MKAYHITKLTASDNVRYKSKYITLLINFVGVSTESTYMR